MSTRARSKPDDGYLAPAVPTAADLKVKGSRFLAVLTPADGEPEARRVLEVAEHDHAHATHVCWAWRLGAEGAPRSSDAAEPSGTAGAPILRALEGADVSDAVLMVVRWFGGTKLGRGGLIRAYGGAARAVLEEAELVRRRPTVVLEMVTDYRTWNQVEGLVATLGGSVEAEFGERVRGKVTIPAVEESTLREQLADLGVGAAHIDGRHPAIGP